jgi:hypothetical protein
VASIVAKGKRFCFFLIVAASGTRRQKALQDRIVCHDRSNTSQKTKAENPRRKPTKNDAMTDSEHSHGPELRGSEFDPAFTFHPTTLTTQSLDMNPITHVFDDQDVDNDYLRMRHDHKGFAKKFLFLEVIINVFHTARYIGRGGDDSIAGYVYLFLVIFGTVCCVMCTIKVHRAAYHTYPQQLRAATFFDQIAWLQMTVDCIISSGMAFYMLQMTCPRDHPTEVDCDRLIAIQIFPVLAINVLVRPRSGYLLATNCATWLVGCIAAVVHTVVMGYTAWYAVSAIAMLTGIVLGFALVSTGMDRQCHQHYYFIVKAERSALAVAVLTKQLSTIISATLPKVLVDNNSTSGTHRSDSATIGIIDIYNFADWSTAHFSENVVDMLQALLTGFDLLVSDTELVERAMSYGDCYVVCGGLLNVCDHHAALVLEFVDRQRAQGMGIASRIQNPFTLRACVCTGALIGGVVGGNGSLRYIVTGPAFDAAVSGIALCGPNDIINATCGKELISDDVDCARAADLASETSAVSRKTRGRRLIPWAEDKLYIFSTKTLLFDDPSMQAAKDSEMAPPDLASKTTACFAALVMGAIVFILLIELGSPDDRHSHHIQRDPLGFGLIIAGFVISTARVPLQLSNTVLPMAADLALVFFGLACFMYGALLQHMHAQSAMNWVAPTSMWCLLFPSFYRRAPSWALHLGLHTVSSSLPVTVSWIMFSPIAPAVTWQYIEYIAIVFVIVIVSVGFLQQRAEADCDLWVQRDYAEITAAATDVAWSRQLELLAGLLPPHALLQFADRLIDGVVPEGPLEPPEPTLHDLCVLQLKLDRVFHRSFAVVSRVWRIVADTVRASSDNLVELVQAAGDVFVIAGPFITDTDAARFKAAKFVVDLVRELHGKLHDICSFTAVATADTARGALLGAALHSFRLVGPALRESCALLAAAPRPLDITQSVAFASEGFRRQHRNFRMDAGWRGAAGMSQALAVSDTADTDSVVECSTFTQRTMWRVKGVGSVSVCSIPLGSKSSSIDEA